MSSLDSPLLISTKLPALDDVQKQLKMLMDRLATYPKGGLMGDMMRKSLQQQIDAKRLQLDQLTHPSNQSGVPPAPEGPAILGPRIETPKVGFNDLKIFLPPR